VHAVDESSAGGAMVRNERNQPPRQAPHNLYGLGPALFDLGGDPKPPAALFGYLPAGTPAVNAQGVIDFHVGFQVGYDPTWAWDGASGTWKRSICAPTCVPQTVTGGAQIAPQNVVIQSTTYTGEAEGQTVGSGDVWVFSDGTVRQGKWNRPDKTKPAQYVDAAGQPMLLRPGRTWVELLPVGAAVDITPGAPPATAPPTTVPPTTTTKKKK
jgi:hypothetical protein